MERGVDSPGTSFKEPCTTSVTDTIFMLETQTRVMLALENFNFHLTCIHFENNDYSLSFLFFSFLLFFLFLSDRNSSNCSLDSSFQSIILNRFSNHPTHDGPLYHLHRIQLRRQVGQTAVATRTLAKCDSLVRAHRAPRQKRGKSARGRDEWDETLRYECEWRY